MRVPDDRRTITTTEAEQQLRIKAATIRAWANLGKLYPVGIDGSEANGRRLYRLTDLLDLLAEFKPRQPHTRTRRSTTRSDVI